MGARTKLNAAHLYGSAVVAGLFGLVAGSWTIFAVALAVTLVGGLVAGDIRPPRR